PPNAPRLLAGAIGLLPSPPEPPETRRGPAERRARRPPGPPAQTAPWARDTLSAPPTRRSRRKNRAFHGDQPLRHIQTRRPAPPSAAARRFHPHKPDFARPAN